LKKISVCIPTYNGGNYVAAQIQSILEQLADHDEIIVSDDSSSDETIEIIEGFSDIRIVLLKNNNFRSPIYNLENAIKRATGDIIILADQDDIWLPGRVALIVNELSKCDLTMTDALIVDEELNYTGRTLFQILGANTGFISNLIRNKFVGCCMAFNKAIKSDILPFPENLPMHDQWIALISSLYYSINLIYEPTLLYRRHGANASSTGGKSANSFFTKFKYRFSITNALFWHKIHRKN